MTVEVTVLAQLSAAAYRNVTERNVITAPTALGWSEIARYPSSSPGGGPAPSDDPATGFSATAYRGPQGQIVIAYCGTNVDPPGNDWLLANAPGAG